MSSYLEHAIKKSRDNGALDVTCNNTTTAVLNSKGQVHLSGVVKNKIQSHFEDSGIDRYVDGRIVVVEQTESHVYVLTEKGRVYEYDPNNCSCDVPLREVPVPFECDSDPVVDISAGRAHLLLLTRDHKVYGYGDNSQYQIVPRGDCRYDCAQRINVNMFLKMKSCRSDCEDDGCPHVFEGSYVELSKGKEPVDICVTKIKAGHDISAFTDDKGRLFTLGNLHTVRENKHLFDRPCLDKVLGQAGASLEFPADALACKVSHNTKNCICPNDKTDAKQFDLSKAKITLNPLLCVDGESMCNSSPTSKSNICQFIDALKKCNETEYCGNTCEPCDNTVYVKLDDNCTIVIVNEKSLAKIKCMDLTIEEALINTDLTETITLTSSTRVDYDINGYSVDCESVDIDKILLLQPESEVKDDQRNGGSTGNGDPIEFHVINVDICQGLHAVQFLGKCDTRCANVRYSDDCSGKSSGKFLTFSGILTPQQRECLHRGLDNNSVFGTYLKGGDVVSIKDEQISGNQGTPDAPLVFTFNKRIVDFAVGDRSLHVVVNCSPCPNEVYTIGNNCYGQLGLCDYYSTLCFKKLNRCLFDCQVSKVFAGHNVTFYSTASGKVYVSGEFDCVVKSNKPSVLSGVSNIKDVCVSKFNLVFLGKCYELSGLGENQYGQLGIDSTCKVSSVKAIRLSNVECKSVCAPCRPTPKWKCDSVCDGKKVAVASKKQYTYPCKNTKTSLPPCTSCDTNCSKPACETPKGSSGCTGRKFRHPSMKVY
jgi:alpha-tubulin suppressor-like RCC1 family protein